MAYSDSCRPKVAVIGTGALGLSISGELARCGCDVRVHDKNEENLHRVHQRLEEQRAGLIAEDLLANDDTFSVIVESQLSCAVMEASFVFEAIVEDMTIKKTLMKNVSLMCSDDTIICSNTLTLSLDDVFSDINHPQRTLGMRFLLPVYFIPLVEVTTHSATSPVATDKVKELLRFIKKESFSRGNNSPRKLMMHEAKAMQLTSAGKSLSSDTRSHVLARGSHDTRPNHGGHF